MKMILPFLALIFLVSCHTNAPKNGQTLSSVDKSYQDLTVAEFEKMNGKRRTVLLDVRTPEETAQGKIAGAIEVNVLADDFVEKINNLDKKKTYLVYCRSGRRSLRAIESMAATGFSKLYNLKGGYNAWSAEHL
jgi:rhodanese-related sulfurtransferase